MEKTENKLGQILSLVKAMQPQLSQALGKLQENSYEASNPRCVVVK